MGGTSNDNMWRAINSFHYSWVWSSCFTMFSKTYLLDIIASEFNQKRRYSDLLPAVNNLQLCSLKNKTTTIFKTQNNCLLMTQQDDYDKHDKKQRRYNFYYGL